jgi:DNA-directed RNA polymerase subunit F
MIDNTSKSDKIQNELADIAIEIIALGDMIPRLFLNVDDMEPETPGGIKIILTDIRKRVDDLRKYVSGKSN